MDAWFWNENASDDVIHFSVSVIEHEFQPIGFHTCHFFIIFIRNWLSDAHFLFSAFFFYRTRISAVRFSLGKILYHFYSKIDSYVHFDSLFSSIGRFNTKRKSTVRFSMVKIRKFINFMHLRFKPTLEICRKVGNLDGKKEK